VTTVARDEEGVNAATHAAGLLCGLAGAVVIVWYAAVRGGPWQWLGCGVYAATLVAAYAASTLSHVFRRPRARYAFRVADQAIIFLFIAGSYTPMALTYLREGPWWWALHALVWGVALAGFTSKAVFSHRVHAARVSAALYLAIGWMPVLAARPILAAVPIGLLAWIAAGGLFYTVGTIFFRYDQRVPYFHAVWHLCVIAGSACHFLGNLFYCTMNPG
jgi:hemolysin III